MTGSGYILHEKASHYFWEGYSPLSIKTFYSGQALYTLGQGYFAVDDSSYLIVNHNQPYTISIESPTRVESFCIFFEQELVDDILRNCTIQTSTLLDGPSSANATALTFFERTYPHDQTLSPVLFHMRDAIADKKYEHLWLQEQFHELAQRLLHVHHRVQREIEALPALRAATRAELYSRLYQAKEYASAFFDTPITLDDMAHAASLSPNHLLRTFKQLFHQTPHQYIIGKRLARAQQLLLHTDQPVTDICFALGFGSLGSFSWLFRQRLGCSPSAYRLQKGDFREA